MHVVRDYADRLRRRGRDIVSSLGLEVLGVASLFIIFPVTLRHLGPGLYGKYVVLYLVFGLVGLWVYAGLTGAVVQFLLQLEREPVATMRLARRQLMIAWAVCSVPGTAIAVAIVGSDLLVPAVAVIMLDLLLTGLANINLANVFAVDGVATSSRIRMLVPLVRTVSIVVLAALDAVSLQTLVAVNILASATLLLVSRVAIGRRHSIGSDAVGSPDARSLLRYSTYYSMSMSTNAVQGEGEKFVLATYRPAAEVGEYAAAYRVVSAALIPLSAITTVANRTFLQRDDQVGAQRARAARISPPIVGYGLFVAAVILASGNLIEWFVGAEFTQAATISAWLCLFPLFAGLSNIPPMGLLGLGRNRARVWMGFSTSMIAIVAYLILVPPLGWRGAVLGTYVSEFSAIVIGWALLIRFQREADADPRASSNESLSADQVWPAPVVPRRGTSGT